MATPRERFSGELFLSCVTWGAVFGSALILNFRYENLPNQVPLHISFGGKVSGLSNKMMLIGIPILSTLVSLLLSVLSRYPEKLNYPKPITEANAAEQYRLARKLLGLLKAEIAVFFAMCLLFMIRSDVLTTGAQYLGMAALVLVLSVTGTTLYFLSKLSRAGR